MKIKKIMYLSFILIILNVTAIFGSTDIIRVGLESAFKDISSFSIQSEAISVGYISDNVYYEGGTITSENKFAFRMPITYFVKLQGNYGTIYQAQAVADTIENALVTYDDNGVWSVAINTSTLADANTLSTSYSNSSVIVFDGVNPVLYDGDVMKIAFTNKDKNVGFKGINDEYITVGNRAYRGYMEIYDNAVNKLTLINVLPFEEYLYAVVPAEMPASWSIEALKAQAVAARTYAKTQMTKHNASGYNVCDVEHCQMYLGVNNENQNSTLAVQQTAGLEAYYNGALIDAVFSSSSGGATANSEDVWVNSLPYLREKPDPYDTEGLVWSRNVSTEDLSNMLANEGQNIGTPIALTIDEKSPNGRVNKLTIVGTTGSYSLTKENIRYFFNYNGLPSLPSRLFTITSDNSNDNTNLDNTEHDIYVTNGKDTSVIDLNSATLLTADDKTSVTSDDIYVMGKDSTNSYNGNSTGGQSIAGSDFTISGKGYGHGVGMSQYGAKGMAEKGYKFDEILKFYYNGIEIY